MLECPGGRRSMKRFGLLAVDSSHGASAGKNRKHLAWVGPVREDGHGHTGFETLSERVGQVVQRKAQWWTGFHFTTERPALDVHGWLKVRSQGRLAVQVLIWVRCRLL